MALPPLQQSHLDKIDHHAPGALMIMSMLLQYAKYCSNLNH